MATIAAPVPATEEVGNGAELKHGTLSLFDSTMIATASVAPAYSMAATIGLLVAAVGLSSPAAILVSFVPVLFVAVAYYYMNRQDPNCGASYTWISKTLSPYVGWFTGWVQTAASVLFCVAAPILAGTNTLALLQSLKVVSAETAADTKVIAVVGLLWLLLVTWMVVVGIRMTANFQWVMVAIEYILVLGFSVAALLKIAASHPTGSQAVSAGWFNPFSLQGISGLAAGAVLGVFFFWGWDTAANLNEESEDADTTPGYAGMISMFVLLLVFMVSSAAVQALVPADTISKQGANALFYFAEQVFPAPLSYLMVVAVLASTVATTQTTLLPATRLTFSMARDGVFPRIFARIHSGWQTPWLGTIIIAAVAVVGIGLTTFNKNINDTFAGMIANIGVLIAFYYGVTGIACAWAFRKSLTKPPHMILLAGILPALSGLFLLWIGYQVVAQATGGWRASIPVLVTLLIGIPLVVIAKVLTKSAFFDTPTVEYIHKGKGEAETAKVV
ncbi:MAG TPA: APC family permease [Candidatus Dormibacteraeota bacterium]|nr:APC family permease [Candidatus Dormibacteraeota bacterium]